MTIDCSDLVLSDCSDLVLERFRSSGHVFESTVLSVPILFCSRVYASCVHTSTHSEGVSVEGVSLDMTLHGLHV